MSTLYVGDSEIDAETAFRAKVPFALYSGGYLRGSVAAFEPHYVFDHFEDLSNYILQRGVRAMRTSAVVAEGIILIRRSAGRHSQPDRSCYDQPGDDPTSRVRGCG